MSENESRTTDGSSESPAAAATPAPQPAPRSGGGVGTVVVSLLFAVAVSGLTVATAPQWSPDVFRALGVPDPIAAPFQRIEGTQARLAGSLGDLEARVAALGEQVNRLAGTAEGGVAAAADLRSAALALAVGELRNALRRPGPFEVELATLRGIAGNDPDVEKVVAEFASRAAAGIPMRAQLREQFPHAAAAIVAGQQPATDVVKEANWYAPWSSVVEQIRYIVRLDTPPAEGAFATVQRARARLSADDLAGAVDELSHISLPEDGPAREWYDAAAARVAADRGANALTTLALARMSAK
ncbi:hypothetical protein [Azospirillum halopraeferens]|uniref:hypothetical protein n=1 Tax=Azospirillum halopraeferens TaxID=34010 RepID=UPI000428B967|nr:hypothetical protein [Azospirillum halopraeferens]